MAYLGTFLIQDFQGTCSKEVYCFTCSAGFCNRCCGSHARHNNGQQNCHLAQIKRMHRTTCVCSIDVKGMGYNWEHIQRLKDGDRRFIPVRRLGVTPGGETILHCIHCHDKTYSKCLYCSTPCKLAAVLTGGGRAAVEALIAQEHELGEEAAFDRFCTSCRHLFASSCCPNHLAAHHAGAGAARLLRVVRQGGLVLTPAMDLLGEPHQTIDQIQTIDLDGLAMVPIRRSEEQFEGDPGSVCVNCFKVTGVAFSYCSLQCWADEQLFVA